MSQPVLNHNLMFSLFTYGGSTLLGKESRDVYSFFHNQIKVTLKLATTRDYRDGSVGEVFTEWIWTQNPWKKKSTEEETGGCVWLTARYISLKNKLDSPLNPPPRTHIHTNIVSSLSLPSLLSSFLFSDRVLLWIHVYPELSVSTKFFERTLKFSLLTGRCFSSFDISFSSRLIPMFFRVFLTSLTSISPPSKHKII